MSIFDHISIPVSDFARSEAFYSSALWALGVSQKFSMPRPGGQVAGFDWTTDLEMGTLNLHSGLALAQTLDTNANIGAAFRALPGSGFVV
jgi:catechol 2,3-dioxygenase-like lactoylglutathione lyase family enzyme